MTTSQTRYTNEPQQLRSHVATAMASMAAVLAVGTWLSWMAVRDCDSGSGTYECAPVPPAVSMLVGLGLTMAAALLLGAALLWSTLRRRVETPTPGR